MTEIYGAVGRRTGTLYVVATPIGNLSDVSFRAADVLKDVDVIAAEDTRTAGKLLSHLSIEGSLLSYHDHNKERVTPQLLEALGDDKDVALISEAGTPGISDPGFFLVRQARRANLRVVSIPGPSAVSAAVSVSGLPSDRFAFLGFPPSGDEFPNLLREYALLECSLVLYQSPNRMISTLEVIHEVLGSRTVSVCRELTKVHEEVLSGSVGNIRDFLRRNPDRLRGEFTLVVAPAGFALSPASRREDEGGVTSPPGSGPSPGSGSEVLLAQVDLLLVKGFRLSRAVKAVARGHRVPRSELYNAYLSHRKS